MKSLFGFAVAGLILLLPLWPASAQDNARDIEAIKQIESRWQKAWNSHDMKVLASLVAEDVDFIAVTGTWLKGRKAFEEHHATRHAMQFKESVWETTDVEVKFLKSDIALVHVNWALKGDKDPDGTRRQPRRGIFTRVATKEGGKWFIKASQNTNISGAPGPK
ncbi:MAG TPA: SgcJ/EcaC family oxidoreductase [Gemmatimonadaceae bacterium]|nr:SgcJ/EcaC family oxidoreductase [Gemmatimonadaceae bacterium]